MPKRERKRSSSVSAGLPVSISTVAAAPPCKSHGSKDVQRRALIEADQTTFRKMLRQGLGDSPVLRQLITDIGTDDDPPHAIAAGVGRGPASTFIDSFDTNAVDLGDIERLPIAPGKDHKNEATRGEQLVHILGERRAASGCSSAGSSALPFRPCRGHAPAQSVSCGARAGRGDWRPQRAAQRQGAHGVQLR